MGRSDKQFQDVLLSKVLVNGSPEQLFYLY